MIAVISLLVFFFGGGSKAAKIIMKHKYSRGEADLQVMLHKEVHLIILAESKGAAN